MNEVFVLDKEFLFKNSIHEVSSISIEHNYDINGSNCEGEFIISGDYRLHEISINKEDFSFKLPFTNEIKNNINLDTIELEITDFSYELVNKNSLSVHIEYGICGEQNLIEFADEQSLDDFLSNNEVEIVDFSEEKTEDKTPDNDERQIEDLISNEDSADKLSETVTTDDRDVSISKETIIDSINSDEVFIKYHVHTVVSTDSIENILAKYSITLADLKKYNTFDTLELDMKLIIPENEEN